MRDNGLFAFCGIPGSGKTLTTVNMALKHYKKENSPIKFIIAYIKHICINNKFVRLILSIFSKYNFIKKIKNKYKLFCEKYSFDIDDIEKNNKFRFEKYLIVRKIGFNRYKFNRYLVIFSKFLFKIIKFFFKFIVLIYIYVVPNWYIKIILFILLFYTKSIKKWFNSLDYDYICTFPHKKINNIYSTFPILLDKKRNIYSHKVSLWDLNNLYSFLPNSIIIIDEIQLFVDSDEYKDKIVTEILRKIGNYFQAHRHYGIKNIIVTSQGVTRIFKKCRDVCSGYLKLNRVFKIPFIPFGFISGTFYYDIDYFGKFIPRSKEERKKLPFDYKKYRCIINLSKIYSAYDSRYLANLNYSKPLLNKGYFNTLRSSKNDLLDIFKAPEELKNK